MDIPVGIPHNFNFNEAEFLAIMRLLDDTDEQVVQHVLHRLRGYGVASVPLLRSVLSSTDNIRVQQTLEDVIHGFQEEALLQLEHIAKEAAQAHGDIDLEEAALLISKFGYPETDCQQISEQLDELSLRVHVLFIQASQPSDLSLLMCINRAFFEEEQFCGAESEYYNPDNSYLHTLMQHRHGIPLSLAVLYMLVAERAGVDLHGIGLPAHFIVFHPELQVFIDAYNHGMFLSEGDCKRFVQEIGFEFQQTMLEKVPNMYIVKRMIKNIIHAHSRCNEPWEAAALQRTLERITEVWNAA